MGQICLSRVDGDRDRRAGTGSEQGKYIEQMGTKGMASPEEVKMSQSHL